MAMGQIHQRNLLSLLLLPGILCGRFFLALNDLEVWSADIQNAYLCAPNKERLYTIAGKEVGPKYQGRPVLIVQALYGLRGSGKSFRDHLAKDLHQMGFLGCRADPDVWIKPATKADGTE